MRLPPRLTTLPRPLVSGLAWLVLGVGLIWLSSVMFDLPVTRGDLIRSAAVIAAAIALNAVLETHLQRLWQRSRLLHALVWFTLAACFFLLLIRAGGGRPGGFILLFAAANAFSVDRGERRRHAGDTSSDDTPFIADSTSQGDGRRWRTGSP